jgi:hypothetical protein
LERVAGEDVGRESTSMSKVAFASFIGTAIEFYDFTSTGRPRRLSSGQRSSLSSPRPPAL